MGAELHPPSSSTGRLSPLTLERALITGTGALATGSKTQDSRTTPPYKFQIAALTATSAVVLSFAAGVVPVLLLLLLRGRLTCKSLIHALQTHCFITTHMLPPPLSHRYYNGLAAGDLDIMRPFYKFYADMIPWITARVHAQFNISGGVWPETMHQFGT